LSSKTTGFALPIEKDLLGLFVMNISKITLWVAGLMAGSGNAFAQTNALPSSGNVGINTTTPTAPLHVVGGNLLARFDSTAASSLVFFKPSLSLDEWRIGAGQEVVNDFGIGNVSRGTTALTITGGSGGGNVGIGTSTPDSRLTIAPGWSSGHGFGINYGSSAGQLEVVSLLANGVTNGRIGIEMRQSPLEGDLWLSGSGPRVMTIASSGNVGIGTTTPLGKLTLLDSNYFDVPVHGEFGASRATRFLLHGMEPGIMLSSDYAAGAQSGTETRL
jgi:hypothetical protein